MSSEKRRRGLSLLKKGHKKIVYIIFSRFGLVAALLILQVTLIAAAYNIFKEYTPHFYGISSVFTAVMVLYLMNNRMDASAKNTWLVIILIMPVFGSLLLWYTQSDIGHRALRARIRELVSDTRDMLPQDPEVLDELREQSPGAASLASFIQRSGSRPVYTECSVTYFPSGEAKFAEMLEQLRRAEQFIFLEYFIIDEGIMWGEVLEILAEKARKGVEVRVMYDGTCEFTLLPHDYPRRLEKLGIKCKVFAEIHPFISTHYNYRDHRKILVIDGHTAFTGGVNLADEYINEKQRFGHWKDTAIMVRGSAARSFTLMFLEMWDINERKPEYGMYLDRPVPAYSEEKGFVIPYGDCPLMNQKLGERVYMDILNRAQRYVHIMTPYLILDGELETALKFAAERGVEVSLILPGIPDKRVAYSLAKTHYRSLLESGVRIHEYTPGFVHAKVFAADGKEAVVGTINLDYRSLYHHFECAAYMYGTACIEHIERDFQDTLSLCRKVTPETIKKENPLMKLTGFIMKTVAPLL